MPSSYWVSRLRFAASQSTADGLMAEMARREQAALGVRRFRLDDFQEAGIRAVAEGRSPVVCAPTSSGKTLVAEAAIVSALSQGKRLFYTSPRKAISNSKYLEFCEKYGENNVGIVTGDVSVNPQAPVVLMTTEIFRNMLYRPGQNAQALDNLQYVVFDECHFIDDQQRGLVWEEAILYARQNLPDVQQIHLSATLRNARQYTDWLNSLNPADSVAGRFELIESNRRPVPLRVQYLSPANGALVDIVDGRGQITQAFWDAFSHAANVLKNRKSAGTTGAVTMVKALKAHGRLPMIQFEFNKAACQQHARQVLANAKQLKLVEPEEQNRIRAVIQAYRQAYPMLAGSRLLPYLEEGIAWHHADLWPKEKELVEVLLKKKLLKAVFATTTLGAGINVPTQSVVLGSYRIQGLPVPGSEYHQMTGRAGRRGMFEEGCAILPHPANHDIREIERLVSSAANAVESKFRVTPHMALSHLARRPQDADIERWLQSGLYHYQQAAAGEPTDGLSLAFSAMRDFLGQSGFLAPDGELTPLGQLAGEIPMESGLLVAKAMEAGVLEGLSPAQLAGVLAATVSGQPPDRAGALLDGPPPRDALGQALQRMAALKEALDDAAGKAHVTPDWALSAEWVDVVSDWCSYHDVARLNAEPDTGALVYTMLRTANLLGHVQEARGVSDGLRAKAAQARDLLLADAVAEQIRPRRVKVA